MQMSYCSRPPRFTATGVQLNDTEEDSGKRNNFENAQERFWMLSWRII